MWIDSYRIQPFPWRFTGMHRLLFLLLILAGTSALVGVQARGEDKLKEQVGRLVRVLDSNQLSERQRAEKELAELGPAILSFLPAESDIRSNEVRQRVARIRNGLEKELAASASGASLVDLVGRMTVDEALRQLARQSGNPVVASLENNSPLQLNLSQAEYWQALDQVLDAGQLELSSVRLKDHSVLTRARPPEQRARFKSASYAGLFRIEPVKITAARDLRNPAIRGTQLVLKISWEPRLQPIYLAIPLASIKIRTDSGDTIVPDDPQGIRTANMEGNVSAVSLQIPLASISRTAKQLRTFSGRLDVVIPGHTGEFHFDDLSVENQRQTQGGVQVILHRSQQSAGNCQLDFTVYYRDAANAFESHRGWTRYNQAWLVDAKGNRLEPKQRETIGEGDRKLSFRFQFPISQQLKDYRFVYQTPVLLLEQSVDFELKEIPLP